MTSHETNEKENPEIHALRQDEAIKRIRSCIAPLTRQLKDLTQLVRGMTTASHLNMYPGAHTNASYSKPAYQPEKQHFR